MKGQAVLQSHTLHAIQNQLKIPLHWHIGDVKTHHNSTYYMHGNLS